MDRDIAVELVDGLVRHPHAVVRDADELVDFLEAIEVPESSRFYHTLPGNKQPGDGSDRLFELSLRRLYRNEHALDQQLLEWKRVLGQSVLGLGVYSSNMMSRLARDDEEIAKMMKESPLPYTLAAKAKATDLDETLLSTKRTILIIPGADIEIVRNWEEQHIQYFAGLQPISQQTYLKLA